MLPDQHHHDDTVRTAAALSQAEAHGSLRAVLRMFGFWGIDDCEQSKLLGDVTLRALRMWRDDQPGHIPDETVDRLSILMGIHLGLRHLFADPARSHLWVRRPSTVFGGRSALVLMLQSHAGLVRVRRFLESENAAEMIGLS